MPCANDAGRAKGRTNYPSQTLVKKQPGPSNKRTELIGVDHEINDEGDGSQHEHQVAHGAFSQLTW